ncbi:MAG: hypothetical protein WAR83_13710 [Flavobacteriales bacterium]|nr:hypothetical protein [Flavobacteriales bacterium]
MENQLTPAQSLDVINQMVAQAKRSFQRSNFFFLLWGVLLATAGIADHYLRINGIQTKGAAWVIAGVIGGVVSTVYGYREGKKRGVSTVMDRVQSTIWGAFGITLVLVIIGTVSQRLDPNPFILLLTGLPTFTTGALIRFRPLLVGGVVFWAFGILSFFYLQEYSSLVFAGAIVLGYLIPGILLRRHENGV